MKRNKIQSTRIWWDNCFVINFSKNRVCCLLLYIYYAIHSQHRHSDFLNCGLNRFFGIFLTMFFFLIFFNCLVAIVMHFFRFKLLHSNSVRQLYLLIRFLPHNNWTISCGRPSLAKFLNIPRISSTLLLSIYVPIGCSWFIFRSEMIYWLFLFANNFNIESS